MKIFVKNIFSYTLLAFFVAQTTVSPLMAMSYEEEDYAAGPSGSRALTSVGGEDSDSGASDAAVKKAVEIVGLFDFPADILHNIASFLNTPNKDQVGKIDYSFGSLRRFYGHTTELLLTNGTVLATPALDEAKEQITIKEERDPIIKVRRFGIFINKLPFLRVIDIGNYNLPEEVNNSQREKIQVFANNIAGWASPQREIPQKELRLPYNFFQRMDPTQDLSVNVLEITDTSTNRDEREGQPPARRNITIGTLDLSNLKPDQGFQVLNSLSAPETSVHHLIVNENIIDSKFVEVKFLQGVVELDIKDFMGPTLQKDTLEKILRNTPRLKRLAVSWSGNQTTLEDAIDTDDEDDHLPISCYENCITDLYATDILRLIQNMEIEYLEIKRSFGHRENWESITLPPSLNHLRIKSFPHADENEMDSFLEILAASNVHTFSISPSVDETGEVLTLRNLPDISSILRIDNIKYIHIKPDISLSDVNLESIRAIGSHLIANRDSSVTIIVPQSWDLKELEEARADASPEERENVIIVHEADQEIH